MRFLGVNIPDNKRVKFALTYIYGIGRARSDEILMAAGVDMNKRTGELTPDELNKIKTHVEKHYRVEGELRQFVRRNIQRLKHIGAYRGARHTKGLPVRGQSTRRNSRTVRGNVRHTAGSGRRKLELK